MKKKTLVIGASATTDVVVGGWALAQSTGHRERFGPPFMRGDTTEMPGPGMGMMHQKGPGMGMMHQKGPGMGPGMMNQRGPGLTLADPAQIEALKRELGITAAQEPAWSKYAKTIQEAAATMQTARTAVDPDAVSKMTPQDRYAFVTKQREAARKQFNAVKSAADELLATLDETQKATAREILPGLASFGPGPMRGADIRGPHNH